jgi:hypothetical protein
LYYPVLGAQLGFHILSEVQKWTPELCSYFLIQNRHTAKGAKVQAFSVTFGCAYGFDVF